MAGRAPDPNPYCPPEYKNRISASTELIRWGPSTFTHAEFLVLLYYAERTLTYGKQSDASSLSQITKGIFSRTKREWIRGPSGIGSTAVKKANKSLCEKGFLIRRHAVPGDVRYQQGRGNQPTEYEINWTALHAEFTKRKRPTLGHIVTKPLGHDATKSLGRHTTNNRGKSSSEGKSNRGREANADRSREERSNGEKPSSEVADDQKTPEVVFASPKVELAYLIQQRGGCLSEAEWRNISEPLELKGIGLAEFVAFLRPHLQNPKIDNPVGLVKSKIPAYRAMTRPAVLAPAPFVPVGPLEEKCPICHEMRGNGVKLAGKRLEPCDCATPEWRARIEELNRRDERQRNQSSKE